MPIKVYAPLMMVSSPRETCVLLLMTVTMVLVMPSLAQARILSGDEAAQATASSLQNEIYSFSSIRDGITLSLAMCESHGICSPTVSMEEIRYLLGTLDSRAEYLEMRKESIDDPDALQEVLSLYMQEYGNYSKVLERMGTMENAIKKPALPASIEEDFSVFEDTDLRLEDDVE